MKIINSGRSIPTVAWCPYCEHEAEMRTDGFYCINPECMKRRGWWYRIFSVET